MVRLSSVLFNTVLAGLACAAVPSSQEALVNPPVHTTDSWSYANCGLPSDPIQIHSISVSPDPPKPGQDLTVKVVGEATEVVEEGAYADVVVKLGLIKLLQRRFDVCEEARSANASVQCPVTKGEYTVEHTVALPKEIPRAKFTVGVRGYTADDDDLVCLDLKVDFMPKLLW
ncbi:ML domain-containing protein [Hygrophoropsis aurantiaca]|uniref:ML domain-containing protein n=1 Tax=Hygrophoropsis aurantiaca TaxID=72124 RepID=A0ACB8AF93_9AGAM|nr:ML domain-containing protein [Hygrophoropsis aurantiaca]